MKSSDWSYYCAHPAFETEGTFYPIYGVKDSPDLLTAREHQEMCGREGKMFVKKPSLLDWILCRA